MGRIYHEIKLCRLINKHPWISDKYNLVFHKIQPFLPCPSLLVRTLWDVETYTVLLPARSERRSPQLRRWLWCWWDCGGSRGGGCEGRQCPGLAEPAPGLGERDVGGSPRSESSTSSRVVEPGLGLLFTSTCCVYCSSSPATAEQSHLVALLWNTS